MSKYKEIIVQIIAIIILSLIFLVSNGYFTKHIHQKCSDDYPNTDIGEKEYLNDMTNWINDFMDKNPDATISDLADARYQYWIDNNCTADINRFEEYNDSSSTILD